MNIYIDENIPYGEAFFSSLGKVTTFSGRHVTAKQIENADILLVRSITQVNRQLLSLNKKIQFVGTATIGTDHIDTEYLMSKGINFSSAPGCNKVSVAEYVLSSLLVLAENKQFNLAEKKVAIVGAGNTGTATYRCLTALGINCKLYDPPLQQNGDERDFISFEEVLGADIISLHVPKISEGPFKTIHLFNEYVLSRLNTEQILINACRGEVVDNCSLLKQAKAGLAPMLVLDVWENEPEIDQALLDHAAIGTPHIAGYSLDGKVRGTEMLYQALTEHLGVNRKLTSSNFMQPAHYQQITLDATLEQQVIKSLVHLIYDVRRDDCLFRKMVSEKGGFDNMRKHYPERRELSTLAIDLLPNKSHHSTSIELQQLGFTIHKK